MTPRIKCAIYTRKSSEEGLDQSFNSLDAQREACEAFIQSQKQEGWMLASTKYDDGGFSGGNMDRPALKKLMSDIAEGKLNTVVVYKVDRLTRSLADFAKIIEQFDEKGVNFVSVTQQFNTTTSMGRLTLNVLLSFAQFEREVTGERIRDKIAASKAKGMWMGGRVPLGYNLRERRLQINELEAERVREIFRLYLQVRTVPALMNKLRQVGIRTKIRIENGRKSGGQFYARGSLYKLLRSRLYIGEIEHKDSIHQGQHEAILDRELWDKVQKLLGENRQATLDNPRSTSASMLTGLLFSESGDLYIPTSAHKGGRRYRYYTAQALIKNGKEAGSVTGRLPAPAIETAIAERITKFLASSGDLLEAMKSLESVDLKYEKLLKNAKHNSVAWSAMQDAGRADLIRVLVQRIVIHEESIELEIDVSALQQVLEGRACTRPNGRSVTFSLHAPFRHVPQGKMLKVVIGNQRTDSSPNNEAVEKAVARAHAWYKMIVSGKFASLADLARKEGLTPRYVKKIFPLAQLSPQSVEFLLRESRTLSSVLARIPASWAEQKRLFAEI
jgi:DNA invertase Pin-like site-specific DNA recombinase